MTTMLRGSCAALVGIALLVSAEPTRASGEPRLGELEGRVFETNGRPAAGYGVVLVREDGAEAARVETSSQGSFRIGSVPAGTYRMEVVDIGGTVAPVGGGATVTPGAAVRRDVHIVRDTGSVALAQTGFGPKSDSWWARRTKPEKVWTVVGIVLGAGAVVAIVNNLSDDDDDEAQASPSYPGR
jgi:hypothetical protein